MLRFHVRSSSSDEVYELEAVRAEGRFRFTCTCEAALNGLICKHRLSLLDGDVTKLVSDATDVDSLHELVRGSKIEQRLEELSGLDEQMAELKRRISATKRALGREMAEGA